MIGADSTIRVTEFLYAWRLVIEASKKLTVEDMVMLEKIVDEMEELKNGVNWESKRYKIL